MYAEILYFVVSCLDDSAFKTQGFGTRPMLKFSLTLMECNLLQPLQMYTAAAQNTVWGWLYLPLETLYLHGPSFGGYGFWGGSDMSTICATSTGTEARFWESHNEYECERLVDKKVTAFVLLCISMCVSLVFYNLIGALYTRWVYVNPIVRELKAFRSAVPLLALKDDR